MDGSRGFQSLFAQIFEQAQGALTGTREHLLDVVEIQIQNQPRQVDVMFEGRGQMAVPHLIFQHLGRGQVEEP
ncbi:hypothetical protein D3C76_1467790 [compost metagenome]